MDILSPFKDHRLETTHKQPQGRKHSCRTGSDDYNRFGSRYVLVFFKHIFRHCLIRPVYFESVSVQDVIAGIYRAAHHTVLHLALHLRRHSKGLYCRCPYLILRQFLSQFAGYLYFFHFNSG